MKIFNDISVYELFWIPARDNHHINVMYEYQIFIFERYCKPSDNLSVFDMKIIDC
jgi:hypothetical protein